MKKSLFIIPIAALCLVSCGSAESSEVKIYPELPDVDVKVYAELW